MTDHRKAEMDGLLNQQRIRTVTGTIDCPECGQQSWNAVLNPGEPCLRCKRRP